MPATARPSFLETALLRRSVDASATARQRCHHCRRTPLVGERIHFYDEAGAAPEMVCDLCRPQRRHAPARSELMHSPEHVRSVRVLGAAPQLRLGAAA